MSDVNSACACLLLNVIVSTVYNDTMFVFGFLRSRRHQRLTLFLIHQYFNIFSPNGSNFKPFITFKNSHSIFRENPMIMFFLVRC